jgi:HlyD family secretion protein
MWSQRRWMIGLIVLAALAAGGIYVFANFPLGPAGVASGQTLTGDGDANLVPVQPASAILGEVSAAGNIALSQETYVVLGVDGTVNAIYVKAGDKVQAGDPLLALDTVSLERSVRRSELAVQSQLNRQQQLQEDASAADVAVAQANLGSALENLAQVRAGPSSQEIAAARSNLSSAQARYSDLLTGPSEAELTQLSADLRRKEVALAEAQRDYDQVAWRNDVGMTPQAAALQQASIDYESSQAAYTQATAPSGTADLQSAQSSIQSAQVQLDDLLQKPTAADIASAEAQVAQAQSTLDTLQSGATATELRDAQISLDQALVDLQEAYANLAMAGVSAPVDGTILKVNMQVGQQGNRGVVVATLADTTKLELTITVSEVDISQVEEGQAAEITIDALPSQAFKGTVVTVAPASDQASGLVNYPVTIFLDEGQPLDRVRPGMSAVARLLETDSHLSEGWLVPTMSIREENNGAVVTRVRDGASSTVRVTPSTVQGEWTVVLAPELQAGDAVVGSVVSQLTGELPGFGPPGSNGGSGGGPFRRGQ